MLSTCKSLRKQLQETWFGEEAVHDWRPPCEIVLHATRTSYSQAVGAEAARTTGSTLIRCHQKRITKRQIDLLVDNKGRLPALAHELTHVVLADRFVGRQPPLWADEGMAVLADSDSKRALHDRDCLAALRNGTALRVADLVRLKQFTSPSEVAAFYGQSQSLVQFLIDRDSPSRFVQFLALSVDQGYDRALREVYEIEDTRQLEKLWQRSALSRPASADDVVANLPRNHK
ncbi:MAG: peptidase MA family metallohydrolase [Pirellulaceae bacterium]